MDIRKDKEVFRLVVGNIHASDNSFHCCVGFDLYVHLCTREFLQAGEETFFYCEVATKTRRIVRIHIDPSIMGSRDHTLYLNSHQMKNLGVSVGDMVTLERWVDEYKVLNIREVDISPLVGSIEDANRSYMKSWFEREIVLNYSTYHIPWIGGSELVIEVSFEGHEDGGMLCSRHTKFNWCTKPRRLRKQYEKLNLLTGSKDDLFRSFLKLSKLPSENQFSEYLRPPESILLSGRSVKESLRMTKLICSEQEISYRIISPSSVYAPYTSEGSTKLSKLTFQLFSETWKKKISAKTVLIFTYIEVLFPSTTNTIQISDRTLIKNFETMLSKLSKTKSFVILGITEETSDIDPQILKSFDIHFNFDAEGIQSVDEKIQNVRNIISKKKPMFYLSSILGSSSISTDQLFRIISTGHSLTQSDLTLFLKLQYSKLDKTKINFDVFLRQLKIFQERTISRNSRSSIISNREVPSVKWGDIGGLEKTKQLMHNHIVLPVLNRQEIQEFLKKSLDYVRSKSCKSEKNRIFDISIRGILMYGPPGTGKTMLARAVATESASQFLHCHVPDLIRCEVGASEKALARIFRTAMVNSPCVIFFDEIQAMFGQRKEMGGYERKLVSQFLMELDGLGKTSDFGVVVLAATNLPSVLDPAMFRSGRFEKLVYVGPPDDEGRAAIWDRAVAKMLCGKSMLKKTEWMDEFVKVSGGYTGADIVNVCQKAGIEAIRNDRSCVEKQDFLQVFKTTKPSVGRRYLDKMKEFQMKNTMKLSD